MNNTAKHNSIFGVTIVVFTAIVTLFVGTALMAIIVRGVPSLSEIFINKEVQFAIGLSLKSSLISTALGLILSIPTAYYLSRNTNTSSKAIGIILGLPLSIPNMMMGLSLLIMFSSMPGKYLSAHGIRFIFNPKGVVLAQLLVNLPFMIQIIKDAFDSVDRRLEVVARTLGASEAKAFFKISLPLAKNQILSAAIIGWSRALGEFGATLMFVGATRFKTETIPASIYVNMATGEIDAAMSCACVLLIISFISLLLSRLIEKKSFSCGKNRRLA